ncbi:hypothetical protein SAMN05421505_14922 [Sinosporangium album]|uniref:Phage Mu protein F like protein n=1 Tax=Sinosporangium album TaxID=504805 RepID=A0A1G8KBQ5_9ACTN|nr:hypothetical protein [Sinosporangium album]SDI40858.1 hypothetical protein SAMN05421505_14922 [Sinosporangium album]
MTPQEYRAARRSAAQQLLALVLPLLGLMPARPSPGQWKAVTDALYPLVYRSRTDAHRLAERFYRDQRVAQGAAAGPVEFPRRNYRPEALAVALERGVRSRLEALPEGQEVPRVIITEAAAVVERHVADAGREAVADAARHDPEALGYARVATGVSTCAFCLMLVSRGPVYKNASAALLRDGGGEPYHNRCDCLAVPVFDRKAWPGREDYLAAEATWQEAGRSLSGLRRHLDDQRRRTAEEPAVA